MDMTIHKGLRWSTASAYLRPALKRPNLEALTKVLVTKIIVEGGKAVGIEMIDKRGESVQSYVTWQLKVVYGRKKRQILSSSFHSISLSNC